MRGEEEKGKLFLYIFINAYPWSEMRRVEKEGKLFFYISTNVCPWLH